MSERVSLTSISMGYKRPRTDMTDRASYDSIWGRSLGSGTASGQSTVPLRELSTNHTSHDAYVPRTPEYHGLNVGSFSQSAHNPLLSCK